MTIETFLVILSGIAWSVVYIDAIRIGLKDRSYAMPFWALALNIAWEFLHAVLGLKAAGLTLQIGINFVWFLLDIGLLYTYFRFGKRYFPHSLPKSFFLPWSIVVLAAAFIIQFIFIHEFGLLMGAIYSAFLQNLLMSILFIAMLIQRNSREGQTILIAVSKCIGTLAPTIYMGVIGIKGFMAANSLVLVIGGLIFFFDLLYIILLTRVRNAKPAE